MYILPLDSMLQFALMSPYFDLKTYLPHEMLKVGMLLFIGRSPPKDK